MAGARGGEVVDIGPLLLARAGESDRRPLRLLSRIIALPARRARGEDDPGPSAA
jgi:hypothetical protein